MTSQGAAVTQQVAIEWCTIAGVRCLKFIFVGVLRTDAAARAAETWKKYFAEAGKQKIVLVWECREMIGYDPLARKIWQDTLRELKNQIEGIWIISDSKMIIAGARLMSLFISIDLHAVISEDKIKFS